VLLLAASLQLIERKRVLVQVVTGWSVCRSACPFGALLKNVWLDQDAVWDGGSAVFSDEAGSVGSYPVGRVILGVNVGHPIVTNGEFVV